MYLVSETIQGKYPDILENSKSENWGTFSYDLQVDKIYNLDGHKENTHYELKPLESVFVSSVEIINMPLDLVGIITLRNSCIRMGLELSAPVYHPGHKTRVFARLTNISQGEISIEHNQSIFSIMFGNLDQETTAYSGTFKDEFTYKNLGEFHEIPIPKLKKISQKIGKLEELESKIYSNIMIISTIFIGIFSMLSLNFNVWLQEGAELISLISYNLILLGGLFVFASLIMLITNRYKENSKYYFTIPLTIGIVLLAVCVIINLFI